MVQWGSLGYAVNSVNTEDILKSSEELNGRTVCDSGFKAPGLKYEHSTGLNI